MSTDGAPRAVRSGPRSHSPVEDLGTQPFPLARALGWASLGLGVPMTVSPGRFVRAIGIRADVESRAWTLAVGVREYAAAAGILALGRPRPVAWLWARVAGDAMDLALLVRGWGKRESTPRLAASIAAVLGIGATDVFAAMKMDMSPTRTAEPGPFRARAAITVRQSREEVYSFWRDFQNLPRFMAHLESVRTDGAGRSHWKATAPVGRSVEWDAEIVEDRPGELLSWRSVDGGPVENSGTVLFADAPGGRGTEIHLDLHYATPGGSVGATLAKLLGEEPELQVKDDLRRFKQVVETGSVVRSEGSPEGPRTARLMKQRPAQPPARESRPKASIA